MNISLGLKPIEGPGALYPRQGVGPAERAKQRGVRHRRKKGMRLTVMNGPGRCTRGGASDPLNALSGADLIPVKENCND